ncbi:DUF3108 domain-containing protein [Ensifer soli]|uniref:DUF3108 domain-containing protein n=1 Tax=Ciceribacter sp. sgz301302 TaxID=3342379 RepID=UPI0035B72065
MTLTPRLSLSAALAAVCLAAAPVRAAEVEHLTDYAIALAGLPVAKASFHTALSDDRYTISGTLRSAGLGELFSKTSGETRVSGTVSRDRLRAGEYSMSYKSGKRSRLIDVSFRNGNVVSATLSPMRKRNPKNWVPVSKADMRNVLDPLSGLVFPATARVCPKTLPIFDGESRLDLKLSAKGTKPFKTEGFDGEAIVCGVQFVPKSGYRKGRKDVEYLRKLSTIEIWFAKADAVNVYAPVYARIPTGYGPVTVSATRFGG